MLLKYGTASYNPRPPLDDRARQTIEISACLRPHPVHHRLALDQFRWKSLAADAEHQIEILLVFCCKLGKHPARKTPLANQVIGGCILNRLIGADADSFGEPEVRIEYFALDARTGQCRA